MTSILLINLCLSNHTLARNKSIVDAQQHVFK